MRSEATTSESGPCALTETPAGMDAGAIAMILALLYGTERFERSFEERES